VFVLLTARRYVGTCRNQRAFQRWLGRASISRRVESPRTRSSLPPSGASRKARGWSGPRLIGGDGRATINHKTGRKGSSDEKLTMTDGSAGAESYVAILELSAEIGRAWNGDAFTAAVAMVYVGIDTMALLSCPWSGGADKERFYRLGRCLPPGRSSVGLPNEAADVYAARCGLLHSYGSLAKDHRKSQPPRQFCYIDNGQHRKDEIARVVVISVAALIDDYFRATESFVSAIFRDPGLKQRVDSRVHNLFLDRFPLG
jgi:hypothetical protein